MIDIFGNLVEMKQIIRFGKELPGYYATKDGKIYSSKTNKFMLLYEGKCGYLNCSLSIPLDLFEDHKYYRKSLKRKVFSLTLEVHRLIAETFIPINENPPIPIEDWINTPEMAKQFIRDCAVVDHIIPDLSNNSVDNLRWTTPKGNNSHRKSASNISTLLTSL